MSAAAAPAAAPAPAAAAVPKVKAAKPAKPVAKKGKPVAGKKGAAKKKEALTFVIDISVPSNDGVLDGASFEKFLAEHIKVGGKTNNLGESISIKREKLAISVVSTIPFSKRYLKYLTKKFLKKKNLKDFMRVVATSKSDFSLKYYNINEGEEEEDEE